MAVIRQYIVSYIQIILHRLIKASQLLINCFLKIEQRNNFLIIKEIIITITYYSFESTLNSFHFI